MRYYTQQHRFYCGVDLHARTLALCILDDQAQVLGLPPSKNLTGTALAHESVVLKGRPGITDEFLRRRGSCRSRRDLLRDAAADPLEKCLMRLDADAAERTSPTQPRSEESPAVPL